MTNKPFFEPGLPQKLDTSVKTKVTNKPPLFYDPVDDFAIFVVCAILGGGLGVMLVAIIGHALR